MEAAVRKITRSEDVVEYMAGILRATTYRECWGVFLKGNRVMCTETITSGSMTELVMDRRRIVKMCLDMGATGVVLVQNHVSGDCTPAQEEIAETGKLQQCFSLFDIAFVDHIIIGEGRYYSFAENMCKAMDLAKVASA